MTDTAASPPTPHVEYGVVVQSQPLLELKRRQRGFAFPLAIAFLAWYFVFVLTAAFAPDVMAIPVFGVVTLGIVLGLGQFVTTFAITMGYVAYANRRLDPLSAQIRTDLEAAETGTTPEGTER